MYRNTTSQLCTPAANISALSQFTSKTNKQTRVKKRSDLLLPEGGVVVRRVGLEDSK